MAEEEFLTEDEIQEQSPSPDSSQQNIPKHRFDEVNRRYVQSKSDLERYSKFGSPEEIEQAINKSRGVYTESELNGFNEQLMRIPAFKQVYDRSEQQHQSQESSRSSFLTEAEGKFAGYSKTLGLPEDSKHGYTLQAIVSEEIRQDPQFAVRFRNGDLGVIDDAFKRVSSGFIGTIRRKRNADVERVKNSGPSQPTSERAIGDSQTRQKVADEKPLTERERLAMAADNAYKRISAMEE